MGGMEYIASQGRAPRPESEILSRGAGVRILDRPKDAVPGGRFVGVGPSESPGRTNDTFGMGTFGKGGSQVPHVMVSSSRCATRCQLTRHRGLLLFVNRQTTLISDIPQMNPSLQPHCQSLLMAPRATPNEPLHPSQLSSHNPTTIFKNSTTRPTSTDHITTTPLTRSKRLPSRLRLWNMLVLRR